MPLRDRTSASPGGPSAPPLVPGAMVSKYRVDGALRVGPVTITYRGHDTMLDRPVTIKQIAEPYARQPKYAERFRREAQVLAKLTEARNVVKIYELVENEQGLFLILEYVEGQTAEELLATERIGVQAGLEVIWQVALGLRSVHSAGIIHRDIQPANILVPPNRKAKITDFGLAAQHGDSHAVIPSRTARYTAPELIAGKAADSRCDIYSLGMVGYELIVGRRRFDRVFASVIEGDPGTEMERWQAWHTSPKTALPPANEINPDVPPLVAGLIAQMTAKQPGNRHASIEELIVDIKRKFAVPRGTLEALATGGPPPPGTPAARLRAQAQEQAAARAGADDDFASLGDVGGAAGTRQDAATDPRVARGRAIRLGIAGLAVVLATVLGIVIYTTFALRQAASNAQPHVEAGQDAYERAMAAPLPEQLFGEAVRELDFAVEADPEQRTRPGRIAHEYLPLARAGYAVAQKRWVEAESHLKEANRRGAPENAVAEARRFFNLHKWLDGSIPRFDAAIADRDFDRARQVIREIETEAPDFPQLRGLRARLAGAERTHAYNELVEKGRRQLARRDYQGARTSFQSAQEVVAGRDAVLEDEAAALITEIEVTRQYDDAVDAAEAAFAREDFAVAADHYARARKLKPGRTISERYDRARVLGLVKQARELEIQGELRAARDTYREALQIDPELEEARQAVADIERTGEWDTIMREGDMAMKSGEFARALARYEEALRERPSSSLDQKIKDCRFQLLLEEGDTLRAAGDWEAAEAKYEAARELGPAATIDERIAVLTAERDYAVAIAEGDAAMAAQEFRKAKVAYDRARALKPGPEIEEKLEALRYARYVDQARRSTAQGDYPTAVLWYKKALELRETPEARQELEKVEKQAAGQG